MAEFKTSFIPKKPLIRGDEGELQEGVRIVLFVSSIFFFATLLIAGGVFLYGALLLRQEQGLSSSITRAKEAIEPELIANLERIDARLKAVENILDTHRVISPIFDLLEQLALASVSFDNFRYVVEPEGKINLQLSGTASNYS